MTGMSERIGDAGTEAHEQLRQLREQVDRLMRERVSPALSGAASRAQGAAHQARGMAEGQAEALSGRIKGMPITSVAIAAAAGYLIGRLTR